MARTPRFDDYVLPLSIIAGLLVLLIPLPAAMLDFLLAANITIALIILLTTVQVRSPLELSIFPTVLLATTLSRLVLNVATTRLILTQADTQGLSAAGGVVRGFGEFVAGDRLLVGLVIFAIIFVIQLVVITKGATRISEVAARFALDGMPGRQLAIDADLASGVIDQNEALQRREQVSRQADFYGAMDGASKFVRGDAIAGALITAINLIGGLLVGVLQGGLSLVEATAVYTKLTIGDGLVSQVPALLISLAAGLLVTRSSQKVNLSAEFGRQLLAHPRVLAVASAFLALLVVTDLPALPLLMLAGGCAGLAVMLQRSGPPSPSQAAPRKSPPAAPAPAPESRIEDYLAIDPVEVEVGVALVRLADPRRGGDLMRRITRVRQDLARDLGIVLPKVRVRDNLTLPETSYAIRLSGNAVAQAHVPATAAVAVADRPGLPHLDGTPFTHPVLAGEAVTVELEQTRAAQSAGYRILSATALMADHLHQTVELLAHELLTRDATRHLLDELRKSCPTVVDELVPGAMKLNEVQQVLQALLREGVPIRQLSLILEALGDIHPHTTNLSDVTEQVRLRLKRTICARYRDPAGRLHVVTLDPQFEQRLATMQQRSADSGPPHHSAKRICQAIAQATELLTRQDHPPIVLTSGALRRFLRILTQPHLPRLIVLSQDEVTTDTRVHSVEIVGVPGVT
jgi:flagellar biosynthesis protein FlhA